MQATDPSVSEIRLLYVGRSGRSGNGLDKRRALERLGLELESFDTEPYLRPGRIRPLSALAHRINTGPAVSAMNRDLVLRARGIEDVDVIWVDKGQWLWPETLRELKERYGALAVHYANDSMLHANRSRHFRASAPVYDVMFTTKRWEAEGYRRLGARRVHVVYDAVDDRRFRPTQATPEQRERFASDVTFIGRQERHYARCLRAVAESDAGVDLRVWGPGWPGYARRASWARSAVRGGGVWFDDYPVALGSARIGLGLLSKLFPEDHTTRSFEIPACGTFLLAERTPAHQALYEEDREATFFEGTEEMVDKIRFYLSHEGERARIAERGRSRYQRSGYNRLARYREMLETALHGARPGAAVSDGRAAASPRGSGSGAG